MKVEKLNIEDIKDYFNPVRTKNIDDDISGLMENINHIGLLQPIGVAYEDNKAICAFGHRRLMACKKLGWKTIDAVILPNKDMTEADYLTINAAENLMRRDPTVYDLGSVFEHLLNEGLNTVEISKRLSLPVVRINECLSEYKRIPEEYRKKVVFKDSQKTRNDKSQIGLATASQIGSVQRKYGLSKEEVKKIYDLAYMAQYNLREIELLASLLKKGYSLSEAKKNVESYSMKTVYLVLNKSEWQKYEREYRSVTNLTESLILSFNKNLILKNKGVGHDSRKNKVKGMI